MLYLAAAFPLISTIRSAHHHRLHMTADVPRSFGVWLQTNASYVDIIFRSTERRNADTSKYSHHDVLSFFWKVQSHRFWRSKYSTICTLEATEPPGLLSGWAWIWPLRLCQGLCEVAHYMCSTSHERCGCHWHGQQLREPEAKPLLPNWRFVEVPGSDSSHLLLIHYVKWILAFRK